MINMTWHEIQYSTHKKGNMLSIMQTNTDTPGSKY